MSGICGVLQNKGEEKISPDCLNPMIRNLGIQNSGEGDWICHSNFGLGSQRLKGSHHGTAELNSAGSQFAIAFFGTLYNWAELENSQLTSDNRLLSILQLYEQTGIEFLSRLRGEFSLAIWDGCKQTLYLATDRFRVHPIFYYLDPHGLLVFGSRIQAILSCPLAKDITVNPHAIADLVARSYIPTPRTIYQEIKKIPPGHVLTYSDDHITVVPYWDINFLDSEPGKEKALARQLQNIFQDALKIRENEDASQGNVGTFLSGGVDSSTVTGVLSQISTKPVKSFSITFDEQRYNEVQYARMAAQCFGAQHYEYTVTSQDCLDCLPILLKSFDEPFANASSIPTYFCAKLALENNVSFLYAGDGGDELFAGNERYAIQRQFDYYSRLPKPLRERLLNPLIHVLADYGGWSLFRKGKKYIQRASTPYPQRLSAYGLFEIIPPSDIFHDNLVEEIGKTNDFASGLHDYYFQAPARTELDRQLYIDLKRAIGDNDLIKVNRMTEAAGVVVRFPFLDMHVSDFASRIPARLKMRGTHLRSFFKRAYADLLPTEIRNKKKHGFGLPIAIWLKTNKALNELMHELVLSQDSLQRGYFKKKTLELMIERHKTDTSAFYGTLIWNFMVLELWLRTQLKC